MSETSHVPPCDNLSVGVIIENPTGEIVLIERGRYPWGYAPPAGHVDSHGSLRRAASEEVSEEVGLYIWPESLSNTEICDVRVDNQCRRPGGDHHNWTVYRATQYKGELSGDRQETKRVGFYGRAALQPLAERTDAYTQGGISEDDWREQPGLEPVWRGFLGRLGYITI